MAKLTFSAQSGRKRPIKPVSSKYVDSKIRPNIEVSDGIRPALPLIPLRYLPVKFQDVSTEQWVVVPKGRIVSAIMATNTIAEPYSEHLEIGHASGDIQTGYKSQLDNSTALSLGSDTSYYGISRDILGLLVPANGGTTFEVAYDADDVSANVPSVVNAGSAVTTSEAYTLPANMPIGVAMYDVYQDIRGAHLNYDLWKNYGVLAEQVIKLPFVDVYELEALSEVSADSFTQLSGANEAPSAISEAKGGYTGVEKYYSFLTFNTSQTGHGLAGALVKSDIFGNFMMQSASLSANRSTQTVGRLIGIDTRHPKDLLETVDTYWDQFQTGTKTAGVPENLYDFAEKLFTGCGITWPSTKDKAIYIRDAIQAGAIGYAHIQISLR